MIRLSRDLAAVALIVMTTHTSTIRAQAKGGDGEAPLHIGGSVRTLGAAVHLRGAGLTVSPGTDAFEQTLLRVTADGRPARRMAFEFHLVQSHTYSSPSTGPGVGSGASGGFGLAVGDSRYRALGATTDWFRRANQVASLWVDRANIKLTLPQADITIGRQAITFGKAYFWNPLDEFRPFDARQFDRDYKAGVDALRVDISRGQFSGANLVLALGRERTPSGTFRDGGRTIGASWYGAAALARYFTTRRGWDLAGQVGKVYGGYELGGGIVGEIRHLEVRGEAAYVWAMPSQALPVPLSGRLIDDHLAAVGGIGTRFQSTLWIEFEHFHNGAGMPKNLDAALVRFASGASLQMGREISGLTVSYDLLPVLTGQVGVLHSWSDGSSELQPVVTYSISDNADVLAGVATGIGPRPVAGGAGVTHLRSEFGSFPRAYFVEFKLYF